MEYRMAKHEDVPLLAQMRKRQLMDEGIPATCDIDRELLRWFGDKLADGSLVEWLAEEDGSIVATAGIYFMELPPTFTNPTGRKGYVTCMYTSPEYRGRGIATVMLERLKEAARGRGVDKLWLGTTPMGRLVHERQGFRLTDEWMEMDI